MTLQEAIEEMRRDHMDFGDYEECDLTDGIHDDYTIAAIATILNAVVKGELVNDR